jgi:predicted ABC-type sugar transport system permease subunit
LSANLREQGTAIVFISHKLGEVRAIGDRFTVLKDGTTAGTGMISETRAGGGNREAAYFSGIDVKLHTLIVFMISGVCSGLAGVLFAARLGAAEPAAGQGFETFAIASAIIGGTSFFEGKGRIPSLRSKRVRDAPHSRLASRPF